MRRSASSVEGAYFSMIDCKREGFFGVSTEVAWLARNASVDYFVLSADATSSFSFGDGIEAAPLRSFGELMASREEVALYGIANALMNFHKGHRHCSKCGAMTVLTKAGACRRCLDSSCKNVEYPRIDPASIMLVTSPPEAGDFALLGRKKSWPLGRWSTLAGFMEVGETLEQCCIREVQEESGVAVDPMSVRYVASQPWPFPRSLMVGFEATALPCPGGGLPVINFDEKELEDARWFSREFIVQKIAPDRAGTEAVLDTEFNIPGPSSLAKRLIENWAFRKSLGVS